MEEMFAVREFSPKERGVWSDTVKTKVMLLRISLESRAAQCHVPSLKVPALHVKTGQEDPSLTL